MSCPLYVVLPGKPMRSARALGRGDGAGLALRLEAAGRLVVLEETCCCRVFPRTTLEALRRIGQVVKLSNGTTSACAPIPERIKIKYSRSRAHWTACRGLPGQREPQRRAPERRQQQWRWRIACRRMGINGLLSGIWNGVNRLLFGVMACLGCWWAGVVIRATSCRRHHTYTTS